MQLDVIIKVVIVVLFYFHQHHQHHLFLFFYYLFYYMFFWGGRGGAVGSKFKLTVLYIFMAKETIQTWLFSGGSLRIFLSSTM